MKKIFYFCLLLLLTLFSSCTDTDSDTVNPADPGAVIAQDDALYHLIERAANTDPDTIATTCMRFQYPVDVVVYDADSVAVASHSIPDDAFFYALLHNLDDGLSMGFDYPVSVTNNAGATLTINNNDELYAALVACVAAQQITWAENIFISAQNTCIWQVGHSGFLEGTNAYTTGGYFTPQADGTLTFNYDGSSYNGTWSFGATTLGLQLIINLDGSDAIATYWSQSYPVTISDESIQLGEENGTRILTHQCETTETYTIGDTGPAGGIVVFDKGEYAEGWRYMEVEITEADTLVQWGCNTVALGTTHITIGSGLTNSGKIKTFFDNLPGYYANPAETCSASADGTVAAGLGLYINNSNWQWFLPSEEELQQVHEILGGQAAGNFGPYYYWTSSEMDAANAWALNFATGEVMPIPKTQTQNTRVRRVRYF